MESLNSYVGHWEPLWLFFWLAFESTIGLAFGLLGWYYYYKELHILKLEYEYDKEFNEQYIIPRKKFRQKKMSQSKKIIVLDSINKGLEQAKEGNLLPSPEDSSKRIEGEMR